MLMAIINEKWLISCLLCTFVFFLVVSCDDEKDTTKESTQLHDWPDDYPIDGDSVAVIDVAQDSVGDLGQITVEFFPDIAPNHVRNFKWLANSGFYDSLSFHRVIAEFVVQGGDPDGTGSGGPGWTVDAEFSETPHIRGILSMARTPDLNSAGSQFFICLDTLGHLDGQYTVFGNMIGGSDVLERIEDTDVTGPQHSTPRLSIIMKSVRIVPRPAASQ